MYRLACSVMQKHALELRKMADQEHMRLVPLIEAALAIMRLSCEKVRLRSHWPACACSTS